MALQELAMVSAESPKENPAIQPAGGNDSNTTELAGWREHASGDEDE
jgi:hypothetical protein